MSFLTGRVLRVCLLLRLMITVLRLRLTLAGGYYCSFGGIWETISYVGCFWRVVEAFRGLFWRLDLSGASSRRERRIVMEDVGAFSLFFNTRIK